MQLAEEFEDVLKAIETSVIKIWDENPEMTNYTVMRAYEEATAHYKALAREQTPKPVKLPGLDGKLLEAVQAACERRLNHPIVDKDPKSKFLSVEDLVACLRRLRKSVDFWTKRGGRTGYMEYIQGFIR